MLGLKSIVSLALLTTVIASPVAVDKRQGSVTCGSTSYSSSQVSAAVSKGCDLFENDETIGSNDYPHTFNNREGFDFLVGGPYQEFPILRSGVYNGGSPGADRVVFNTNCQYAGSITHTGASGNNFVGCSDVE